jgi:hypothetical protein
MSTTVRRLICLLLIFQTDCFYEKRTNTALHGYNDLHDHWLSDFDCFERCLRTDQQACRSFEHWRSTRYGLCVRANISLADDPSAIGRNAFVDYYEIDCQLNVNGLLLKLNFLVLIIDGRRFPSCAANHCRMFGESTIDDNSTERHQSETCLPRR